MNDSTTSSFSWDGAVRQAIEQYEEPLLRQVAGRLIRARSQWPPAELIDRSLSTIANAAVIDRRLRDLPSAGRQLLAIMAHGRQPRWRLGSLVELAMALGQTDGLAPVLSLLQEGLAYPESRSRLRSFEQWLGLAGSQPSYVFSHPLIAARTLGEDFGLPNLQCEEDSVNALSPIREADGLEFFLRLAILWQLAGAGPLRRTQGGEFFKRDLDRLVGDPLINSDPADALTPVPSLALLTVALAESQGVLHAADAELRAGKLPSCWDEGLLPALASIWSALPALDSWGPHRTGESAAVGNPYASAYMLAALLLAQLPGEGWAQIPALESWIQERHPHWESERIRPSQCGGWLTTFLLGVAYPLRLVQARQASNKSWLVRLSPVGRWILALAEVPPREDNPAQTLLVQPNLEIIAYRQGLTPALVSRLSLLASWKSLGPACTLQLGPDTIYRALESGLSFEDVLQTLDQHGTRPLAAAVIESLRTWAGKRERIRVFPSAALVEFSRPEDLQEALARGVPLVSLGDRLAVAANESAIDYKHFRLAGARDYSLPPERCLEVGPDGVTLTVDVTRSDLLLESELARFAEPVDRVSVNGRRQYHLSPSSLAAARAAGINESVLETWFMQRTGQPMSAAARLLLGGSSATPPRLERYLVLQVSTEEIADGVLQWPPTRALIADRLGPTALVVRDQDVIPLKMKLQELGMRLSMEPSGQIP